MHWPPPPVALICLLTLAAQPEHPANNDTVRPLHTLVGGFRPLYVDEPGQYKAEGLGSPHSEGDVTSDVHKILGYIDRANL